MLLCPPNTTLVMLLYVVLVFSDFRIDCFFMNRNNTVTRLPDCHAPILSTKGTFSLTFTQVESAHILSTGGTFSVLLTQVESAHNSRKLGLAEYFLRVADLQHE